MANKYLLVKENPYKGGGQVETYDTLESLQITPKTQEGFNTQIVVNDFSYEFEIYSDNNSQPWNTSEANSFFTNDVDYVNKESQGSITGITIINGYYPFYRCHYDTMYVSEYYQAASDKIENQGESASNLDLVYKFHLTSSECEIYTKDNNEKTYTNTVNLSLDTNHCSNNMPIHLFARPVMEYNTGENINSCEFSGEYTHKFYYFKAWHDGTLISHIVPQKSATHWRLYDIVRNIAIYEEEL